MKRSTHLVYLAALVALLAACGSKDPQAGKSARPTQASIRAIKKRLSEIAGQANGAAPADIDPDTRLDGAKAGPGLTLSVTYTLVNAETNATDGAAFATKLKPTIEKGTCANADLRPLIDQGVLVVLEYRGNQGNTIGTVNIDRATCAALK